MVLGRSKYFAADWAYKLLVVHQVLSVVTRQACSVGIAIVTGFGVVTYEVWAVS